MELIYKKIIFFEHFNNNLIMIFPKNINYYI